ncbi:fibronectin type III domain-containing protein [Coraliomargarita sp. W4R72]
MSPRQIIIGTTSLMLAAQLQASYLDDIGLTALRARDASLDGSGVTVAQVEASTSTSSDIWQTDPANTGLNSSTFTYYDSSAPYPTGTTFSTSKESTHANRVGSLFFGLSSGTQGIDGIAPGVASVEMYFANYHPNSIVVPRVSTPAKIVNYSFVFNTQDDGNDLIYDRYIAQHNVLFCNGIFTDSANDDAVATLITSPASSYNCIAIGVIDDPNLTSLADGRSKPDLVAPASGALANYTSYTTPVVSGAATLLYQSALREDAGSGTATDATDTRTLKALLLNSATKTTGWSNTPTHPLDRINGAGQLEINNAQKQLAAGQHAETVNDASTSPGSAHLPLSGISTELSSNIGWNFSTLSNPQQSSVYQDTTDHYYFECDATAASSFNLTATLVWNRNFGQSSINNLDLFLYKEDGTLITSSVSTVDNVEHLYQLALEPGRYVLQVYKPASGRTSVSETYALVFNFAAAAPLAASSANATTLSSSTIELNWTDNANRETGYRIERRSTGGNYSTLTTLPTDSEFYSDNSCTAGTTYEYQIIAYNDDGSAPAAEASATTYTVQENWRLTHFASISNSGDGADNADPEHDGLVNLIEFATGSEPLNSSQNPIDAQQIANDQQFSFTWRSNNQLDYSIGYSEDLSNGFTYYSSSTLASDLSAELEWISTQVIDSEFETLTYGIKDSVSADKAFIRLQIESP